MQLLQFTGIMMNEGHLLKFSQQLPFFAVLMRASLPLDWSSMKRHHLDYSSIHTSNYMWYPFSLMLLLKIRKWYGFCFLVQFFVSDCVTPVHKIWRRVDFDKTYTLQSSETIDLRKRLYSARNFWMSLVPWMTLDR